MVKKDGIQKQREELEKRKASVKSLQANLMGDIEKFFHVSFLSEFVIQQTFFFEFEGGRIFRTSFESAYRVGRGVENKIPLKNSPGLTCFFQPTFKEGGFGAN